MEPGRQINKHEADEAKILSALGPRFKQGNYLLHFRHQYGETYRLNALLRSPGQDEPLGVGSMSFDARTGETHVAVHPDHQNTALAPVLLAAGNKISRLLGGVGLQGVRNTTDDSFRLIKRFFPEDSTKITRRKPEPPMSDYTTQLYTEGEGRHGLSMSRKTLGSKKWTGSTTPEILHSCFSCGGNGSDRRWLTDHVWSRANDQRRRDNQGLIPADCPDCGGSGLEQKGRTPESFIGLS
jgi:hypothetical protein